MEYRLPDALNLLLTRLHEAGFSAYIVGGSVRDLLRGVTPHDYDITTSALPEEIQKVFRDHRCIPTGIRHGTVTVLSDGEPYEITTYRVDGDYKDNRHPDSVTFTRSLREDAARRDFTVNAMAYNEEEGLLDYFGGKEDLQNGILRAVGDPTRRFREDALRILRALRFSATLGYRIEDGTAAAIRDNRELLHAVSAERVREELCKLLCGDFAEEVLREYRDVIAEVLPEIRPTFDFDQHTKHHIYDIYTHTLKVVSGVPKEPVLRLAALFHDLGKPASFFRDESGIGHFYGHEEKSAEIADAICRRLAFDNKTRERVTLLVGHHGDTTPENRRAVRKRLSALGDAYFDWIALKIADNRALAPSHLDRIPLIENAKTLAESELASAACLSLRDLQINGDDLIAAGIPTGKKVGALLNACLTAVMDERVPNARDALLAFALSYEIPNG